jgi:hypothetical protein
MFSLPSHSQLACVELTRICCRSIGILRSSLPGTIAYAVFVLNFSEAQMLGSINRLSTLALSGLFGCCLYFFARAIRRGHSR